MVFLKVLIPTLIAVAAKLCTGGGSIDVSEVIEWDVMNWSLALDFWGTWSALDLQNCCALELGAGNGGLSLWLALQGAFVVCSDLRNPARFARALHKKYNVENRVEYQAISTTHIPYENHFDLVVFKSMLGDVGRNNHHELQHLAVEEIFKSLKPGGELWFAENLVGSPLHRLTRRFIRRGKLWRYLTIEETGQLLENFSEEHHATAGFLGVFGRDGRSRNLLGALDRYVCNRLVPERWKYVVIVRARK